MIALPLSVLALAAGVYLLVKVKREYLGGAFSLLAWLVIALSIASIAFTATKAFTCNSRCNTTTQCHAKKQGGECPQKSGCQSAKKHCNYSGGAMAGCHMEGDSCVMDKAVCEKMMGKEACDAMVKQRGRCILSKEECMQHCKAGKGCMGADSTATGKACCQKKNI